MVLNSVPGEGPDGESGLAPQCIPVNYLGGNRDMFVYREVQTGLDHTGMHTPVEAPILGGKPGSVVGEKRRPASH